MVKTGSSAVIGSWKIIATVLPRKSCNWRSFIAWTSRPATSMPPSTTAFFGSSFISARSVTDLPEPDSPRMHSDSPAARSRSTPFTALTLESRETKRTVRSRSFTSGAAGCIFKAALIVR